MLVSQSQSRLSSSGSLLGFGQGCIGLTLIINHSLDFYEQATTANRAAIDTDTSTKLGVGSGLRAFVGGLMHTVDTIVDYWKKMVHILIHTS